MTALPVRLELELSGQCNLRCPMCSSRLRKEGPPKNPPAFMTFEDFRRTIEVFDSAEELSFQGLGEPLMHPHFFDFVAFATDRGLRVTTSTNMTIMGHLTAERCVTSGLAHVFISIDAATPRTFEKIRCGARLPQVERNIGLLQEAKSRLGSDTPGISISAVAMRENIEELDELVKLARRCSIDHVDVKHLAHGYAEPDLPAKYRPMHDFYLDQSLLNADSTLVKENFERARKVADRMSVELKLPAPKAKSNGNGNGNGGRKKNGNGKKKRCDSPWNSACITYQGFAVPCEILATPDRVNFGSVVEQGAKKVWNSDEFESFRERLSSDHPPDVCLSCSVYRGAS